MSGKETKRGMKQLSPIDIYMLLPKTNCKECGEDNCMAFATKVVNREVSISQCLPLLTKEQEKNYNKQYPWHRMHLCLSPRLLLHEDR